jgi:hypothetical protein
VTVVSVQKSEIKRDEILQKGTPRMTSPPAFSGPAWNYQKRHKQKAPRGERGADVTYGTDTFNSVDVLDSSQGADGVVVSSNRDVDIQLGALKMPQTSIFHIGSSLQVLVKLLGDGVWDLNPRIGRVDVGGDLAFGSTGDGGFEGSRPIRT